MSVIESHLPDIINGLFEAFGAWSVWANVKRLKKDRDVKGIVWQFTIVWWLWGIWNLYYYRHLNQTLSWLAGMVLVIGNAVWLYTWIRIKYRFSLRGWLNRKAYPSYECEDCISMREHGCYCSAMDAIAPCTRPTRYHNFLRWLLSWQFFV